MKNDSIVFRENLLSLMKKTVVKCSSSLQQFISLSTLKILPQFISTADDNLFQMCSVRAVLYTVLTHQEKIQIFAMSMKDIDKQLTLD